MYRVLKQKPTITKVFQNNSNKSWSFLTFPAIFSNPKFWISKIEQQMKSSFFLDLTWQRACSTENGRDLSQNQHNNDRHKVYLHNARYFLPVFLYWSDYKTYVRETFIIILLCFTFNLNVNFNYSTSITQFLFVSKVTL